MLNLIRAEIQKIQGNILVASLTLWVYPVGAFITPVLATVLVLIAGEAGSVLPIPPWTQAAGSAWAILIGFPTTVLSRLLVMAFMAVCFAGEYEWQTWKNIVPRTNRAALITVKWGVLATLIMISLFATSIIWTGGMALHATLTGQTVEPGMTGSVLRDFLPQYLTEAALAYAAALLMAGFAALAVLLTRTTIGGLILGLAMSTIEVVLGFVLYFISYLTGWKGLVDLYAYFPTYQIENIRAWQQTGAAVNPQFVPGLTIQHSLGASIAIFAAWIVGLLVIAILIFQRQDLAS